MTPTTDATARPGRRGRRAVATTLVGALLLLAGGVADAAPVPTTTVAGGNGPGAGLHQLSLPVGVAVDAQRNVYVSEAGNNRVVRWGRGDLTGEVVAGGNGAGSALDQFDDPEDVVLHGGDMYIVDAGNHRVLRWTPGAASGTVVAGGNGQGNGLHQLSIPTGLAVDPAGNLYIADNFNHRVVRWAPGASSGVLVAGGNGSGPGANQLYSPSDVAIGPDGDLYVIDLGGTVGNDHQIVRWTPGAATGTTVAGGNGLGSAANQIDSPSAVVVDRAGRIYVAESANDRVSVWEPGASTGTTYAGGTQGTGPLQLHHPAGLAFDAAQNVYIADANNQRVQFGDAVRPVPLPAAGFPDVAPSAFYAGGVDWARWTGVTTGVGSTGSFQPDLVVSRGQMVTFLHRMVDAPTGHPAHGFPDVAPTAFYEVPVRWAAATGVTTGVGGSGLFVPDMPVTRAQAVVFLWRTAGSPGGYEAHPLTDTPAASYYEEALRWAYVEGITTGYAGTAQFRPDEPVDRGQMVTFLHRLATTPTAWGVDAAIPGTVLF